MEAVAASRQIDIRPAWPQDQAFVAATFREQLARRSSYRDADRIVDRILDSDRTRILLAVDGKRLVGWLAYVEIPRVRAVLFTYVRKEYRGGGLARQLVDTAWPRKSGSFVHAGGLAGGDTTRILARFPSTEVDLGELI